MSSKVITVGDHTDHGGVVLTGSSTQNIHGRAIARVGDMVSCPLFYPGGKPHGVNKIVTGYARLTIHGVAVAVDGCKTECGCTLIGSRPASVE